MDKESSLSPRTGFERHCASQAGYAGWQIISRARHGIEHKCSSSIIGNGIPEFLRKHKEVGPCCRSTERHVGGWCEIHRSDLTLSWKASYSYLSACIGSTEAARRAGATQASPATITSNTVTPPRMMGSRELSVTHFVATLSKIRLRANPAATPAPTFTDVAESTMRTTSRALAPSAMRIPNSLVLDATPYETTL